MIDVPQWEDVARNYSRRTNEALAQMMASVYRPGDGQLILWRGEPGTGKTWALRALIRAWAGWADFQYITDPDRFFGGASDYMMNVIFNESSRPWEQADKDAARWRVLILEDSGELLTADARANVGQGLARLLNIVDGLIGQGMKILILVTTNEDLGKLHPAVTRPGRCLVDLPFEELSIDEVEAWFATHKVARTCSRMRLAELYASLHGREVAKRNGIGFLEGMTA